MLDFIVNTGSGRGLGGKNLRKVTEFCRANGIEFAVHETSAAGDAKRFAASLAEGGASVIVAVGGDGTFHEVLNGIPSFERVSLGFVPSGRGNDFARGIGLPLDPVKALKVVLAGRPKRLDYIRVGDVRCLNIAGTGLDIDVLRRVAGRQGKITYLKSLLYCVRHFDPYSIDLTLPDEPTRNYKAIMIGICNGRQFGGGMKLSPHSVADDGKLELIIIEMPKSGKLLGALVRFLRGKHLDMPITTCRSVETVTIHPTDGRPVQLDGEIYENLDLECEIVKGGIRTFDFTR